MPQPQESTEITHVSTDVIASANGLSSHLWLQKAMGRGLLYQAGSSPRPTRLGKARGLVEREVPGGYDVLWQPNFTL